MVSHSNKTPDPLLKHNHVIKKKHTHIYKTHKSSNQSAWSQIGLEGDNGWKQDLPGSSGFSPEVGKSPLQEVQTRFFFWKSDHPSSPCGAQRSSPLSCDEVPVFRKTMNPNYTSIKPASPITTQFWSSTRFGRVNSRWRLSHGSWTGSDVRRSRTFSGVKYTLSSNEIKCCGILPAHNFLKKKKGVGTTSWWQHRWNVMLPERQFDV